MRNKQVGQAAPEVTVTVPKDVMITVTETPKKTSDFVSTLNYSSDPAGWDITADLIHYYA